MTRKFLNYSLLLFAFFLVGVFFIYFSKVYFLKESIIIDSYFSENKKKIRSFLANKININESELALAAEKGGIQGAVSLLLNKGFIFTKIADSFAIASGGATFYRNRIKTYEKQGLSKTEADDLIMSARNIVYKD